MDNQNTAVETAFRSNPEVLILVLMDNQNTYRVTLGYISSKCLNPCSNG